MTVFLHSTDSQRVILHSVVGSKEKDCGCSFTNDEKKKINYDLNFYNYRRLSTVIIELNMPRACRQRAVAEAEATNKL